MNSTSTHISAFQARGEPGGFRAEPHGGGNDECGPEIRPAEAWQPDCCHCPPQDGSAPPVLRKQATRHPALAAPRAVENAPAHAHQGRAFQWCAAPALPSGPGESA